MHLADLKSSLERMLPRLELRHVPGNTEFPYEVRLNQPGLAVYHRFATVEEITPTVTNMLLALMGAMISRDLPHPRIEHTDVIST